MNGLFWIVLGGITGWLTGKLIGEKGYGEILKRGYATNGLDILFGVVGASVGGYLFFSAVIGEGSSFSKYAAAVLGSFTLVGVYRLISARYLPAPFYKGMSRDAFIEWQDTLAVKEMARWKPRTMGRSTTPTENCQP